MDKNPMNTNLVKLAKTEQKPQSSKLDEIKITIDNIGRIISIIFLLLVDMKRRADLVDHAIEDKEKKNKELLTEVAKLKAELDENKKRIDEYEKKIKILDYEKTELKFEIISLKESLKQQETQKK
jgi:predicted nuclease with TOPRIM domain